MGEMDVARVRPYRFDQGTPRSHGPVRAPTASGGHPIHGGGTRSATYLPGGRRPPDPDYVGRRVMGYRGMARGEDK